MRRVLLEARQQLLAQDPQVPLEQRQRHGHQDADHAGAEGDVEARQRCREQLERAAQGAGAVLPQDRRHARERLHEAGEGAEVDIGICRAGPVGVAGAQRRGAVAGVGVAVTGVSDFGGVRTGAADGFVTGASDLGGVKTGAVGVPGTGTSGFGGVKTGAEVVEGGFAEFAGGGKG